MASAGAAADPSLLVSSLEATPVLLGALSGDCPPQQAWRPPEPGEWSLAEVVRHLVEGDRDTFLPRLRRMLAEERPVFEARRGAPGAAADLPALLRAFQAARGEVVGILGSLDARGWRREGVSPSRGPLSIAEYARTMAEHDTEHLRQIHGVREALGLRPRRAEARLALPLSEVIAAVERGPEDLRAVAEGLTPGQLRHRPLEGEWSMKEVMAHLLKVERDLFLPRLRRLAREERPRFERFDPDGWASERDHREGDFAEEWRLFAAVRRETVTFLRGLPPGAADRIGLSAYFGPVTLGQYATHVAEHDQEHLLQLARCRAAALEAT
jgi:hypothetical protein